MDSLGFKLSFFKLNVAEWLIPFSDCGEQRLHPEESLVPAGGGNALLPSPWKPGAGHLAGFFLTGQRAGLPLLGEEEAGEEEERLA